MTRFRFGRRTFVRSLATASAGIFVPACGTHEQSDYPPGTGHDFEGIRVVIIGSGFGGSIAALRLAQVGIRSTILERGRRWPLSPEFDTFCTTQQPDARCAWMSDATPLPGHISLPFEGAPYVGLLQRIAGDNIDAVCAAAVGGGSLVYSGIMIQPPRKLFESVFPSAIDYAEMDEVYYPRVRQIMKPGKLPADILASDAYFASRVFIRDAEKAGLDVGPVDCAFDFDKIREELDGAFPLDQVTKGDYLFGLNNGAKHSIDRIGYLKMAEDTGLVDVRPLHQVREIGELADRPGYYVVVELIDENGVVLDVQRLEATHLFLAAGSLNTTKLLLRARRHGTLPNLNDQIGKSWGNNGQRILSRNVLDSLGLEQGGPACVFVHDHDNPEGPIGMEFGPAPIPLPLNMLVSATQGVPERLGELQLDLDDEIRPVWDRAFDASAGRAANHTMQRMLDAAGGVQIPLPGLDDPSITFHPLGGATMGKACDTFGRVHGYANLYVVDGALIPGSTPGGNPFWTISAIAERCLDAIVAEDLGLA